MSRFHQRQRSLNAPYEPDYGYSAGRFENHSPYGPPPNVKPLSLPIRPVDPQGERALPRKLSEYASSPSNTITSSFPSTPAISDLQKLRALKQAIMNGALPGYDASPKPHALAALWTPRIDTTDTTQDREIERYNQPNESRQIVDHQIGVSKIDAPSHSALHPAPQALDTTPTTSSQNKDTSRSTQTADSNGRSSLSSNHEAPFADAHPQVNSSVGEAAEKTAIASSPTSMIMSPTEPRLGHHHSSTTDMELDSPPPSGLPSAQRNAENHTNAGGATFLTSSDKAQNGTNDQRVNSQTEPPTDNRPSTFNNLYKEPEREQRSPPVQERQSLRRNTRTQENDVPKAVEANMIAWALETQRQSFRGVIDVLRPPILDMDLDLLTMDDDTIPPTTLIRERDRPLPNESYPGPPSDRSSAAARNFPSDRAASQPRDVSADRGHSMLPGPSDDRAPPPNLPPPVGQTLPTEHKVGIKVEAIDDGEIVRRSTTPSESISGRQSSVSTTRAPEGLPNKPPAAAEDALAPRDPLRPERIAEPRPAHIPLADRLTSPNDYARRGGSRGPPSAAMRGPPLDPIRYGSPNDVSPWNQSGRIDGHGPDRRDSAYARPDEARDYPRIPPPRAEWDRPRSPPGDHYGPPIHGRQPMPPNRYPPYGRDRSQSPPRRAGTYPRPGYLDDDDYRGPKQPRPEYGEPDYRRPPPTDWRPRDDYGPRAPPRQAYPDPRGPYTRLPPPDSYRPFDREPYPPDNRGRPPLPFDGDRDRYAPDDWAGRPPYR
ncbi:hypothetical protein FRB90_000969, partial [Tulasnella sp. 427]